MTPRFSVLGLGEPMVLLDPAQDDALDLVDEYTMREAGAEMNTLIGLARLGHAVALVTALGNDPFGTRITSALEREGVGLDFITTMAHRTGLYFKERVGGERGVYYYREGSAAARTSPDQARAAVRESGAEFILTSGLNLGLGDAGGMRDAVLAFLAEAAGSAAKVVFDANVRREIWSGAAAADDFARIVPAIDYLLVGADELAELMPDGADASALVERGITAVFVKHGAEGATVVDRSGSEFVPAIPTTAVDSIGAGDAFAAGVISGLLRGWGHGESARLGAVLGARAVQGTGDWETLPYARDLELTDGVA